VLYSDTFLCAFWKFFSKKCFYHTCVSGCPQSKAFKYPQSISTKVIVFSLNFIMPESFDFGVVCFLEDQLYSRLEMHYS